MIFGVSTGRSGTTSLAQLLDQAPDCRCVHEPDPQLRAEASQYAYGDLSHADMVALLRETRPAVPVPDGVVYGEMANKLAVLIPALREAFPAAKYIWLIRDGRDTVASLYRWGFYSAVRGDTWEQHRLRADRLGLMSRRQWLGLSRFEKCCWYWTYINETIAEQLDANDCDRYFIRLEDLTEQQNPLFAFCGLIPPDIGALPHLNSNRLKKQKNWQTWTRAERRAFAHFCGSTMDRHYPGWQTDAPGLFPQSGAAMPGPSLARTLRSLYDTQSDLHMQHVRPRLVRWHTVWRPNLERFGRRIRDKIKREMTRFGLDRNTH